MMSEGNSTGGVPKTGCVLGDVTNRIGKRGLFLISGNLGSKSGDEHGNHVDGTEGDSQFTEKVVKGVENIVKEKCEIKCVVNDVNKGKRVCASPRPSSEINSLQGNIIFDISKVSSEMKESNTFDDRLHLGRIHTFPENVFQGADASRSSYVSCILMPMAYKPCASVEEICKEHEGRITSEVVQSDLRVNELVTHCKYIGADNLKLEKCAGLMENGSLRLPESQSSGSFKLEKCVRLKGNGSSSSSAGVDMIKECSCSLCLEAGYILSDLHYQDVKGRIAALKKSQKEASLLVQRICRDKGIDKHNHENCNKSTGLESHLISQWRSLFLHMEDILVREGTQLEAGLRALKDVRENCKAELEMTSGRFEKQ